MKIKKYNVDGDPAGDLEISATLLEDSKGEQAVHDCVVAYLAAKRSGNASTKTKGFVRGGGAKPWRQKGTGRARAGSIRSPLWRGGGVIFGPHPRSFAKKVNKKVRALALRRVFTERLNEDGVVVVADIEINEPKTKACIDFLKKIGAGNDALILTEKMDDNFLLSSRNIPKVESMNAASVDVYNILLHKKIVITEAALDVLEKRISKKIKTAPVAVEDTGDENA
ncbi:MAG: 50S ribosomal protein L4 [Verrucomicrobiota bacterium]|nr:50S ribosomal protein L4 [Verrucomicrobiota bacterium]